MIFLHIYLIKDTPSVSIYVISYEFRDSNKSMFDRQFFIYILNIFNFNYRYL